MKRIILFVLTNIAVVAVLGIVASLLGVNRFLTANGLNLGMLLVFAAIMGFLWLGVAPLVTGYIGETFGLRWQAMLGGIAFMVLAPFLYSDLSDAWRLPSRRQRFMIAAAGVLGKALADADLKLVYGGGGVGLMGAVARAAHTAGGEVLGIIPTFLVGKERALEVVEHIIVDNMHERKMLMFQRSDSFIILPGGIGTLEEVIELLSWRRLDLHHMPVVFYSPDGFWDPLFALFQHTVNARLTPESFMGAWSVVETVEEIVPALYAGPKAGSIPMLTSIV